MNADAVTELSNDARTLNTYVQSLDAGVVGLASQQIAALAGSGGAGTQQNGSGVVQTAGYTPPASSGGGAGQGWGQAVAGWWGSAVSEAGRLPNTFYYFWGEIPGTFASGEAADSVLGAVNGTTGALNPFGGGLPVGTLYGNQGAYAGGQGVGQVTGFFMNVALTVSGVQGMLTAARSIQSGGGLLQVLQFAGNNGRTLNLVVVNGQPVVATIEGLAAMGITGTAAANIIRLANDAFSNGGGGGAQQGLTPDIARKIAQFEKKSLGDQKSIYRNLFRTYEQHLEKYGQTAGATAGETNRMERELAEMRRILGGRGRTFESNGGLLD